MFFVVCVQAVSVLAFLDPFRYGPSVIFALFLSFLVFFGFCMSLVFTFESYVQKISYGLAADE